MKVLTLGTFDLFHAGHVRLLERCRRLAGHDGRVEVGLNTDEFVERYKGRRPVIDYPGREEVLLAVRFVDWVLPNDQPDGTIRGVLEAVQPDAVVASAEWGERWFRQVGVDRHLFRDNGIRIVWHPYTDGVSTTTIRERIA